MGCLSWFHPGKKTVWCAWFIHFACYIVFVITGSKAFHESSIANDWDPFALLFFVFPVILVAFFLFHSLYLLMGMVDAWTSYWHSGVVTCSASILPYLYLVFALYVGRICWPPAGSVWATLPDGVCKEELKVSVGFAFTGMGTLGLFGFVFLLFVRKQDGETRNKGDGGGGGGRLAVLRHGVADQGGGVAPQQCSERCDAPCEAAEGEQ